MLRQNHTFSVPSSAVKQVLEQGVVGVGVCMMDDVGFLVGVGVCMLAVGTVGADKTTKIIVSHRDKGI